MHGEAHAGSKRRFPGWQPYHYYTCSKARMQSACWAGKRVPQELILNEVIEDVRQRFADEAALEAVRAQVAWAAARGGEDLEAERQGLKDRVAELDGMIRQGNANLALLPADVTPGVVAQVRAWRDEREEAARRLDRMAAAAQARDGLAKDVEEGLEQLKHLARTIRESPPEEGRAALCSVVESVTVHLRRAERNRNMEVTCVDVEYTPWVVSLFATG
jgi:hypothetical protein